MIAQSQSGTGKTAAFVLAMLSRVDPTKDYPQVLCLSPTYELAIQTGEVAARMSRFCPEIKIKYAVRGEESNIYHFLMQFELWWNFYNWRFHYFSKSWIKDQRAHNYRNSGQSAGLGTKIQILWFKQNICLCIGWSGCNDCYTRSPRPMHPHP